MYVDMWIAYYECTAEYATVLPSCMYIYVCMDVCHDVTCAYVGHDDMAVRRAMREGFMAPSLFLFPLFP